ncbi:MAG: hypothetical protein JST89_21860 [Cyanobacteria bacterium SZAS-4]|nr:hypothetical protein [Cyanobacteria bacterium SZAS-4]
MIQPPAKPMAVHMPKVFATSQADGPAGAPLAGPPMQALQRFPTGHCVMQFVQMGASHSMHFKRDSA